MDKFISVLGFDEKFPALSQFTGKNFEVIYQQLADSKTPYLADLNAAIWDYFASLELPDRPTLYDLLILTLRYKISSLRSIGIHFWLKHIDETFAQGECHGSSFYTEM